jgi:hypothetical protein
MTIARGQMKRQLYQDGTMPEGGLPSLEDIMEGKISPAELALIKETLEDVEFMQEGYNLDNEMSDEDNPYSGREGNMRAQGGIMSVGRENFGIGSKLKKTIRKLIPNEVADIAVKAAPIVGYFNPALGATMQGLGSFDKTGRIGDSLKRAAIQYAATQGARSLTGGTEAIQGNPFEYGADSFFELENPATLNEVYNFSKPFDFSNISIPTEMDQIVDPKYSLLNKAAKVITTKNPTKKGQEDVNILERVIKGAGSLTDIAKVAIMGKAYFDSREDQERFNKLAEEAYKKYTTAREAKREQYLGDGELTGIEVLNPTRTKADIVQAAQGGIINSRKGYMMGSEVPIRKNQAGVSEMDFRETGGFVPPVGIKEKADDIPAMLSNNEFVFTADAVRAAGGGSVNKGAQKMYALMKQLEGQA